MTESTAVTTSMGLLSAFSVTMIYPNIENGIILGALCGSTLLILNEEYISLLRRITLFIISFLLGILLADFTVELIGSLLTDSLKQKIPLSLGALITSAITIKPLIWIIKNLDNPLKIIKFFRGRKL